MILSMFFGVSFSDCALAETAKIVAKQQSRKALIRNVF
jgi:hypothetical protein